MSNPFGAVADEFKNAPPAGKALAIVALLTVAGIGLYVARKGTSSTAAVGTTSGSMLPIDLSGNSADNGVIPFPNFPAVGVPVPVVGTTPTVPGPVTHPVTPVPIAGGHPVTKAPVPIRYAWTTWWGNPGHPTGDPLSTLSGMAQKYYGNSNLWTKIYAANRSQIGSNPNLIQPGMRLVIPN